jgi:hypothetical protein
MWNHQSQECVNCRKQHLHKTKEKTSPPTDENESLFLSCLIDATEHQYVLVFEIPAAFVQLDIHELVRIKFDGTIIEVPLHISLALETNCSL